MDNHEYVTYEEFGRRFFEVAVTEDRVGSALAEIAGDEFTIGPIAQGPGRIAKVTADVAVGTPQVRRSMGITITFTIRIPLTIHMTVDVRVDKPRFTVEGEVSLRATARAAEPLLLIIDVNKPRPNDIAVRVTAKTLRAEVVRVLGGVDEEIRRFIAAHVSEQIDSPQSQQAKIIDVAKDIEKTWSGG